MLTLNWLLNITRERQMRKRRTKSWERFPKIEKIEYDCDRRIWYYTRLHIYNNRCLFWNSCFSFQMKRKAHTRGAFLPTEKRLMRQQRAVHSSSAQRHCLRKTKLAWKTHRRYWNVTIWYFLVIAGTRLCLLSGKFKGFSGNNRDERTLLLC